MNIDKVQKSAQKVLGDYSNEYGDEFVRRLKKYLQGNASMDEAKELFPLMQRIEYSVGMQKKVAQKFT